MNKYLIITAMFMVSAVSTPTILETIAERKQAAQSTAPANTIDETIVKPRKIPASYTSGRTANIEADRSGHFIVEARMNGKRIDVLVDTGATYVAINASTAKRLGIRLRKEDFKYEVSTANGRTKVAVANVDKIKIGRITVEDVAVTVSQDDSLETVLLGMSYLKKLSKFSIEDNMLHMKQ